MDWGKLGPEEYEILAKAMREIAASDTPVRYNSRDNDLSRFFRTHGPLADFSPSGTPETAFLELLAAKLNENGILPDGPWFDKPTNAGRLSYSRDLRSVSRAARTPVLRQGLENLR